MIDGAAAAVLAVKVSAAGTQAPPPCTRRFAVIVINLAKSLSNRMAPSRFFAIIVSRVKETTGIIGILKLIPSPLN